MTVQFNMCTYNDVAILHKDILQFLFRNIFLQVSHKEGSSSFVVEFVQLRLGRSELTVVYLKPIMLFNNNLCAKK